MMKRTVLLLGLLAAATMTVHAGPQEEVEKALREGLPEVALVKLEAMRPADEAGVRWVALKRAEALLRRGDAEGALRALPGEAPPALRIGIARARKDWEGVLTLTAQVDTEAAPILLARVEALARLGRRPEAIALLERSGDEPALRLCLSEQWLDAGEAARAKEVLETISAQKTEEAALKGWRRVLEARILLAEGRAAAALERLAGMGEGEAELAPELRLGALFATAEAHRQLGDPAKAASLLERFLWDHREAAEIGQVFERLDAVYASDEGVSYAALDQMARRRSRLRAGYAVYYRARAFLRSQRGDRALRLLAPFAETYPGHPILARALLLRGQLQAEGGETAAALETLEEAMRAAGDERQRGEIEMATATAQYQAGEFVLAATLFEAAGARDPSLRAEATFRAALCWLHQGNRERFEADFRLLHEAADPRAEGLLLEEARLLASRGDPGTADRLRRFLLLFPRSPLRPQANFLLAEWELTTGQPDTAAHYLEAANPAGEKPALPGEATDALAIFVADAREGRDDEKIVERCRRYLREHPEGARRLEVRMKLGEVFFRQGDFAGAQNEFETVARESPGTPLAEGALYLAGQAATRSMSAKGTERALALFEEVARSGGGLRFQARLAQAALKNQSGQPGEAILLYDAVLEAAPPKEIRFAALAGKARSRAEQGGKEALEAALDLYRKLATEAAETAEAGTAGEETLWRSQALYQSGRTLEALERPEEALAAYYDVLESGREQPQEYFWYYKAGFEAGRLCETLRNWEGAIAIYRKMAALEGPRREEAHARMAQLRLEHFIWE